MTQQIIDVKTATKELESILTDENKRKNVEEILDNFSKFERAVLIDKIPTIILYLKEITGPVGANLLMAIVSKAPPEVDEILTLFENVAVRDWAKLLNRKHVGTYEGAFPPFPHDWYRVYWSTTINTTYGIPFIATRILKRNGEVVYLDQPFATALALINHQLRQMNKFKEKTKAALDEDVQKGLKEIQGLVGSLLADEQKS